MALACQRDSYLKELTTSVESCEAATEKINGTSRPGYHITLKDSVLFPEGGGQPDDRGMINDAPVLKVYNDKSGKTINFTPVPVDPGTEVHIKVDWVRRFDHMQQHSAQHLISAVAETEYNLNTTSWSLGDTMCKIEFDTPQMKPEMITRIESLCNQFIREQKTMYPSFYHDLDDPAVQKIKTRGLPDNIALPLRVITIEGVDENLCCGTHVSNLSHLQAIKLVGTEKGKKGCTLLSFHAGDRVLKALEEMLQRERQINTLLTGSPSNFPELVKKLQTSFKTANKNASNLLKELVAHEAQELSSKLEADKSQYLVHHRREGDNEYMLSLMQKLTCTPEVIKFITIGDDRGAGSFLLCGPAEAVAHLGPQILPIIDGKGAAKGIKMMGKANKLSQKGKVEKLIKEYVTEKDTTVS